MDNMELWNKVAKPPKDALKQIFGGRLKGMTDINPQWRLEALTEHFGQCGVGWYYTIDRLWMEPGSDEQIACFAIINLYTKVGEEWSQAISGIGGSAFVAKEKNGLHTSDECYKMAVTDAISVAAKALGLGAEIYAGRYDGSKYKDKPVEVQPPSSADFEKEVDQHGTIASIEAWWKKNATRIDRELSPAEKDKLISYCRQIKEALAETEKKFQQESDETNAF